MKSKQEPLILAQISEDQTLTHHGDLIIEGNIGKNSTIKVINGSLIIEGTIESGTKILVSNNLKNETAFKFKVWGHIQDSVSIQSDVAIEILGNIGDRCFIKSNYAGLKARNIGKEATIDVLEKIVADHIGKYSRLFSRQQGLTAEELDDNVLVNVIGEIDINENIGNRCNLKNQKGGLIAGNIGKYVTIDVGGNIQVCDIDIGSILNSKKGGLKAHDIGNKVTVNVRNKIHVNNLEDECKIYSQKSGIKVDGKTRSDLELEARDDIKMNDMGKCCSVKSTHGKITFENSGDSVFITARYLVKGIGVGKCSQIISTKDSVHLKYLLRDVKINAEQKIRIDKTCPSSCVLVSKNNDVRKPSESKFFSSKKSQEEIQEEIDEYFTKPYN